MGTPSAKTGAFQFEGMLDRVRIYNYAMSEDKIAAHFKDESAEYGFDTTWFSRLKATPYFYLERGEVVIEADFKGLQPFHGHGRLEATLSAKNKPNEYGDFTDLKCLTRWGGKSDDYAKKVLDGREVLLVFDEEAGERGYYLSLIHI